jgi:cytoskeletal protein CcmA (bactofilin family)
MYDCTRIIVPQSEEAVAEYDWANFPPAKFHKGKTSFSIIDESTGIEGKLIAGTAFIHGQVQGLVFAEHVTIEPTGRVDGIIFCRTLAVLGSVCANIICDNILVRSCGRLSATLKYRSMKIEPGGLVGGRFERRVIIDGRARSAPVPTPMTTGHSAGQQEMA